MDVKMIHVLPADSPRVHDRAEAVAGSLLGGQASGHREEPPQQRRIRILCGGEGIDVPLRDDHEVDRRLRADVVEGEHVVVLVHLAAGDLAFDDPAEDAFAHGPSPRCLAAFSSSPVRPSRRASSASTSSTPTPCWASMTRQWNQRSAVSCTTAALSPALAAITVSVASSPIFLR